MENNTKQQWTKLKVSVYFGWIIIGLIPICAIIHWIATFMHDSLTEHLLVWSLGAAIILCLRYSLFKPVELTGAALAGILTISIMELISRGRVTEQSFIISGIVIGLMLLLVFMRGIILSLYYLGRESYQYFQLRDRMSY